MEPELSGLAARLEELAEQLSDTQTSDEEAVALAREAAELSAQAGKAIDSALAQITERGSSDADSDAALDGSA